METTDRPTRIRQLLATGAAFGVAATVVNAAVYAVGNASGVDYIAKTKDSGPEFVQLHHVVSLSVISFAIGLAVAVVAAKVSRRGLRALPAVGAVIAVASTAMDLGIDASATAKITLALMHLVIGAAYVAALRVAGTRRPAAVVAPTTAQPTTADVTAPVAA
jgi:hypothetical protein